MADTIAGTCLMVVEFSVLTYFVLFLFESLSLPEVAAVISWLCSPLVAPLASQ